MDVGGEPKFQYGAGVSFGWKNGYANTGRKTCVCGNTRLFEIAVMLGGVCVEALHCNDSTLRNALDRLYYG